MTAPARPAPALPPAVAAVVADAKAGLAALYGDRLDRVVLYGSYARGDARPDSDVDLLVVLHGDVRPYDEIRRMSLLGMELLLRSELSVSMQPYSIDVYRGSESGFIRNVQNDGVTV